MQQIEITIQKIVHNMQQLPPEFLVEVGDFVEGLLQRKFDETTQDQDPKDLLQEILSIGKSCSELPLLDSRSPDEILGYNAEGLPE